MKALCLLLLLALLAGALSAQVAVGEISGTGSGGHIFHGYVAFLDFSTAGKFAPVVIRPAAADCVSGMAPLLPTYQFAADTGVFLALNGSFSDSAPSGQYLAGACLRVWGPVKSAGQLLWGLTTRADGGGDPALLFTDDGIPQIRMATAADVAVAADVIGAQWNDKDAALAPNGSLLIANGVQKGATCLPVPNTLAPRTAVGLTDSGVMVAVVVEGRLAGYSAGITLPDLAWLMASLGAVNAINFDGGGSSAMVYTAARVPVVETARLSAALHFKPAPSPPGSTRRALLQQRNPLEPFSSHAADGAPDYPYQLFRATTIHFGFKALPAIP